MNSIDISTVRPGPFPIVEPVGSCEELSRALRVRYYRTVCAAEVGRTIDPPRLVKNLFVYSGICKHNRWSVIILRPELNRPTWGVAVMLPPRSVLERDANPSTLVDEIYTEIRTYNKDIFKDNKIISVMNHSYHMYQGLTLPAGETLAFRMADVLGWHTGAIHNA